MALGRSYPTLRYVREKLSRWPATTSRYNSLQYGPFTVKAQWSREPGTARREQGEKMTAPGQVFVVLLSADKEPNGKQMAVMTVDHLIQIMTWLMESDPDMFVRPRKHRKGTQG